MLGPGQYAWEIRNLIFLWFPVGLWTETQPIQITKISKIVFLRNSFIQNTIFKDTDNIC